MSELIFGTGVSAPKDYNKLKETVMAAIDCGIFGFDTAPSYKSEKNLGQIIKDAKVEKGISRDKIFIQSKVDAWQMQQGNIKEFIYPITECFGGYIDSLLIHWPVPAYMDETWEAMCDLQKEERVKKIGICNVKVRQLDTYLQYEVKPQIIQIERNPLRICQREINICKEQNIAVQAYSPLCKMNKKILSSTILEEIAAKYNKNIGQIVMRWHIDTGVIPIFTTTKVERIQQYSDTCDFSLTENEIMMINNLNENYKMYLESVCCPGF